MSGIYRNSLESMGMYNSQTTIHKNLVKYIESTAVYQKTTEIYQNLCNVVYNGETGIHKAI